MASDPAPLRLTITPVSPASLADREASWRRLEERAARPMLFTSYDWLRSWAQVMGADRLLLLEATGPGGEPTALGLLQTDRLRNLRFAGGDLTPTRRPLCRAGAEEAVWAALAAWLRDHGRAWSTFEATGIGAEAAVVPGGAVDPREGTALALPAGFDEHLATLSERNRNELRRRLRRSEEAGVAVRRVGPADVDGALADFLAFHRRRAQEAGIASEVDEDAVRLLRTATAGAAELDVVEVRRGDERLAVSVNVVHRGVMFPYAIGWDPSAQALAPGILLTIDTIQESLRRGLEAIDMGPGAQRYKLSLGFTRVPAGVLHAASPAPAARARRALGRLATRLAARRT